LSSDGKRTVTTETTEHLWAEVHQGLRGFVARRVADPAEAEDILQQVYLRLHQGLGDLKDLRRVTSWIVQVTRHAIADYYRSPRRRKELPAGLAGDLEAIRPMPDPSSGWPEEDAGRLRKELAACLRPMLKRLPREYREAVTLVELEGLTQPAAAKRLGLSVSGMKSRVQRGRRQLKRLLDECCVIELDARRGIADYAQRHATCDPCGGSQER
jgi:RNA polymerase sigma-70 factor (ECF subfamily)